MNFFFDYKTNGSSSNGDLQGMVLHGLGYALMPGLCIKGFADWHTFELPSKDNKNYSRKTWLIYHDNSLELSFVNVFIKLMKERTINIQL